MDARPIGIFDSGAGGLTVLHECLVTMPGEDFLYLGDGARCPYGPRCAEEIRRFALEIGRHLERERREADRRRVQHGRGGRASVLQERLEVPVVAVLAPEAHVAVQATRNRHVGVLATEATVASGRYADVIHTLDAGIEVVSVACPRLVPHDRGRRAQRGADRRRARVRRAAAAPPAWTRSSSAARTTRSCARCSSASSAAARRSSSPRTRRRARWPRRSSARGSRTSPGREGRTTFLTTGAPDEFAALGERFLQLPIDSVGRIDLHELEREAA